MGAVDARPDLVKGGARDASLERRLEKLPDNHPASPRYGRDNRGGVVDEVRPLTDAEHTEHIADVRARIDEARKAGLATDRNHTIDGRRKIWSDERDALHDQIVDDLYGQASDVPRDGHAILAGGLPGSGKTSVLIARAGIDRDRYLMINPDAIKEEMARRGLIPVVAGLSPMEASDLVHEEASRIAKRLAHRAQGDRVNLIWDVTMSEEESTTQRLELLRAAGYGRIDGIFVDIPVEVSVRRADARYREDHDDFRRGEGFGGRYVPPELIFRQSDPEWGSQNRRTFESLKARFDSWWRYDNSVEGGPAVIVESKASGRAPHDYA